MTDLPEFTSEDAALLHQVAEESIRHGLEKGKPMDVDPGMFPPDVAVPGAAFVTLTRNGKLRGCVGSILPTRSLVEDVARNAYGAAFLDPRFPSLEPEESQGLELHISVLTPMVPVDAGSRGELIQALRPGVDGLLLEDPPHRATFLPQVWESLEDPEAFLTHLFLKAGLPPDHWTATLRFRRYQVVEL